MATPSLGYSVILRVQAPSTFAATGELASAAARADAAVTALDIVESHPDHVVVDVSCNVSDASHCDEVRDALSRAYTPGVARVCMAIHDNPEDARRLTLKRNTVAVVTDGTAVLGLGDIGPAVALPVMEGEAPLFKAFAGVDAWPVCLDTKDTDEIVHIVKAMAPVDGGVNLEDIAAMAGHGIVFAMANPDPEVDPAVAAKHASVVATGRSDFPNQINNVLAFPGLFRGLLDAGAADITTAMLIAAARAIAGCVHEDERNASYIVPSVFDPAVAEAVRQTAEAAGAAAEAGSPATD
jgi:malic enzyme